MGRRDSSGNQVRGRAIIAGPWTPYAKLWNQLVPSALSGATELRSNEAAQCTSPGKVFSSFC